MLWTKLLLKLERELELRVIVEAALEEGNKEVVAVVVNKEVAVEVVKIRTLLFLAKTTLIPWSCNLKTFGSLNSMLHGVVTAKPSSQSTTLLPEDLRVK
jgi:hypothetical protein